MEVARYTTGQLVAVPSAKAADNSVRWTGNAETRFRRGEAAREVAEASQARVETVRRWAMSLCSPRELAVEDVSQLSLPPLRPLKAYVPDASKLKWNYQDSGAELSYSSSYFHSPRISQMTCNVYPNAIGDVALEAPAEMVANHMAAKRAAVDAAHRGSMCRTPDHMARGSPRPNGHGTVSPRRHRHLQSTNEADFSRRRQPPIQQARTVCRPDGRPVVRGCDPMAGNLFSREADIDPMAVQRGVYEAQLVSGQPVSGKRSLW